MSATRVVLDSLRDAKVRALVILSLLGVTAGVGLLTAGAALAVTGSEPGNLSFNPPSGASTLSPTWSTTDGCPTNFQGSAVLYALNTDGSIGSSVSPTVANVTTAFSGTLLNLAPISQIISFSTNVTAGGTSEFVVQCTSGAGGLGNATFVQSEWVTLSADGTHYTTSSTPPTTQTPTSTPPSSPTTTPPSSPTTTPPSSPTTTPPSSPTTTPPSSPTTTPPSGPTSTGTSIPAPTPESTGFPSGAPGTGGGVAPLSASSNVLTPLGAVALAGSAVAMGLAIRRARRLHWQNGPGRSRPGGPQ